MGRESGKTEEGKGSVGKEGKEGRGKEGRGCKAPHKNLSPLFGPNSGTMELPLIAIMKTVKFGDHSVYTTDV